MRTFLRSLDCLIQELTLDLEEADIRLILPIYQAILKGFSRIAVLSNGTDVFIVILHNMNTFVKTV